ncbi:MAG: N-6 DNA methylase [Leptospiraceae bacterium]|nr:N-6 DNA methylase [Leptospiraceae bacterium]
MPLWQIALSNYEELVFKFKEVHIKESTNKAIFNPEALEFHASCAEGLHEFLEQEVKDLGLKLTSANRGGVFFKGKKESVQKFLLTTRFSSRVSFSISQLRVEDAEDLYDQAVRLPWEEIIAKGLSFKIDSNTKDSLKDSRYALYKLKDAIKDRLRDKREEELEIDRDEPDLVFHLRSNRDFVNLELSLTSHPFNKRGYRLEFLDAPIRENMAQALIHFSGWNKTDVMIDPMCGSGTILIEAALLLKRKYINETLLNQSAVYRMLYDVYVSPIKDIPSDEQRLFGYDINPKAIQIAKDNARRAGVDKLIHFEKADVLNLTNSKNWKTGHIVMNPPYGERLGTKEDLKILYGKISARFKQEFPGFRFTLVSGDKSLLGFFKLKEDRGMNVAIAKMKGKFVSYELK